jgi:ABC-type sulfate transport system permease component
VAGLAVQLATTLVFVSLAVDFVFRLATERPHRAHRHIAPVEGHSPGSERDTRKRWGILLAAVFFSAAMLVMRAVYRTVDYAKGECRKLVAECCRIEANVLGGIAGWPAYR